MPYVRNARMVVRAHELAKESFALEEGGGVSRCVLEGQRVTLEFPDPDPNHVSIDAMATAPIVVRAWVDPPLDLGLDLRLREPLSMSFGAVTTGDADLDGELLLHADEPARVRELFTPELREELLALHGTGLNLRLGDAWCGVYGTADDGLDRAWIERAFHGTAKIAAQIERTRSELPSAAPLAPHAEALRELASARKLSYASTPLRIGQSRDGRTVELAAIRTGRGRHHLVARASFAADLGVGLAIRRAGWVDGVRTLLGRQDIQVGDAAFDRRFLVRADPAHARRVAALLDTETRASLLAVDERAGALAVDDRAVVVDPIPVSCDPKVLVWMFDALGAAAEQIGRSALRAAEKTGPYR